VPLQDMPEIDFITAVVEEADYRLLRDVNNVYVNSVNHGYDVCTSLRRVPADRIAWAHLAGHRLTDEGLRSIPTALR
jgi:uncharacterized protein (UPF0276 family)